MSALNDRRWFGFKGGKQVAEYPGRAEADRALYARKVEAVAPAHQPGASHACVGVWSGPARATSHQCGLGPSEHAGPCRCGCGATVAL